MAVFGEELGSVVTRILITLDNTILLHTSNLILTSNVSIPTDLSCCCSTSFLQILREYPAKLRSGISFQLTMIFS